MIGYFIAAAALALAAFFVIRDRRNRTKPPTIGGTRESTKRNV